MKTTTTTFVLALCFFSGKIAACDCFPIPNFCETITFGNNGVIHDYLNIYHIEVSAQTTGGMEVAVLKTFHGPDISGQTIFIVTGNGANCVLFTDQFQVGQQLIISAEKGVSDWQISECGVSFLHVANGQVTGNIAPGILQIPLADFPSMNNCGDLSPSPVQEPEKVGTIRINPTLAQSAVYLKIEGLPLDGLKVTASDASGRQVYSDFAVGVSAMKISVAGWPEGVYFFSVEIAGRRETFRIVRQKD